ncbi:MAG: hypothetical protein PHH00_01665 [Candidatus Nanoarchaeia archaeon]|nr:hypothetical protein [Candidatus Nanoarchaeia archaeon]
MGKISYFIVDDNGKILYSGGDYARRNRVLKNLRTAGNDGRVFTYLLERRPDRLGIRQETRVGGQVESAAEVTIQSEELIQLLKNFA